MNIARVLVQTCDIKSINLLEPRVDKGCNIDVGAGPAGPVLARQLNILKNGTCTYYN